MAGPNNEGTISTSSSPRLVSEQIGSRKRQKVTRACDACKSKKKRCTGEQPCVPCLRARAKCTYEAQYNRGIALPPSPAISRGLESLDPISSTPVAPVFHSSVIDNPPAAYVNEHTNTTTRSHAAQDIPPFGIVSDRVTARTSFVSTRNFPSDAIDDATEPASGRLTPELDGAIDGQYLGPSSAQSFLGKALQRLDRDPVRNTATRRETHVETESSILSFGDAKVHQPDITEFTWPEYRTATWLLEQFFEFASPTYRYFHEPSTKDWLKRIYDKDDVPFAAQACILLIFASASVFTVDRYGEIVDANHEGWQSSEMYYQKAETLLSQETGPPHLESVQARFAAVQYLLSSSRPNKGLLTFGVVIQLMQVIGVHRKQSERAGSSGPDPITVEVHRRLFWCAFTLDKYLSIAMGRLPFLRAEDTTQALPMIINDEEITLHGVQLHKPTYGRDCLLTATVAHIEIGRILARASQEQSTLPTTTGRPHVEAAVRSSQEIREWHSKLTPVLSGAVHPESLIPCFRRQQSILTLARLHTTMFVTRPLLLRDLSSIVPETEGQQYRDHLRGCIQAARDAIETINGSSRYRVLYPAFWFSQYVAFFAISIVHIYIIQVSRNRIPANLFDTTSYESSMHLKSLYELALVGQSHLVEAGVNSAPVWRYGPILESLSTLTSRYISPQANDPAHGDEQSSPQANSVSINRIDEQYALQPNQRLPDTSGHSAVSPFETEALWMGGYENLWDDLMAGNLDDDNLTMDFWPQFDNLPIGFISH